MSATTKAPLTPRQRLNRGLAYTAVGPVDVTRGVVGLGLHSAQAGASNLRRRYQEGRLARELQTAQETIAQELAAAQDVITRLPEALKEARRTQRRSKRPWVLAGLGLLAVAGGAAAFSIIRRSARRETTALPPSVEVQPRP